MISRYSDLLPLMRVDLPDCPDVLIIQNLQEAGRYFCRETEAWREKLTFNIVDANSAYTTAYDAAIALGMSAPAAVVRGNNARLAARDYSLKSHYDAETIRPWKVWETGDESQPEVDPARYRFDPMTATLTFISNLQMYTPKATTWLTTTAYAAGDRVISNSLRYECSIAHTSGTFATDLAAYRWQLLPNDLIVKAVLIPRVTCNELAAWFMDKWAEGIIAQAKVTLMSMKDKAWSSPERVPFFNTEYTRYKTLALRERRTEDKSIGGTFQTPAFVR